MSADDNAPEQALEVEVLVTAVVAHQRIPFTDWPGMSQCSGCDHLYGETDGPNSPRVVQHQVEVALAALAPIRAAERREAAREALLAAADDWRDGDGYHVPFERRLAPASVHGYLVGRADGVTGRSGT